MTTLDEKRAYVAGQGQSRDHRCHWPGCRKQVPPAQWGCSMHWGQLPKSIRDGIWNAYRPGQERFLDGGSVRPTPAYMAAADAADAWIRQHAQPSNGNTANALSLWQPWASACAIGAKTVETRDWATSYRGPLWIHAAKHYGHDEMAPYVQDRSWRAAMRTLYEWRLPNVSAALAGIPLGGLVGLVDLIDCKPTERFERDELLGCRRVIGDTDPDGEWCEAIMGNFAPGRFGWVLDNPRPLRVPIALRGRQKLFEIQEPHGMDHPEELFNASLVARYGTTGSNYVTILPWEVPQ